MTTENEIYLIRAITSLHPGSEGTNAGIVDNLVQRDPISGVPVLHATSLKGSLREFFTEDLLKRDPAKTTQTDIEQIFGKNSVTEITAGAYKFFQAEMLSIPVRSNQRPYFNATSPEMLESFLFYAKSFGNKKNTIYEKEFQTLIDTRPCSGKPKYFGGKHDDLKIDDIGYEPVHVGTVIISDLHRFILGNNIAIFHHDDLKDIASHLPVVARNQLKNGESKNLWYEEIVPRESRFYFHIIKPENDRRLQDAISGEIVQVGGNASVGYGYCSIINLNM